MQTRCPYNQWLCGHHVNVVKDYKDTKSTKSLRTQCRRSQRHSVSIVTTGYSRTSLWNKKRLQNQFCLFIWSPGRVLWPRKGRKSRDIVLLRPNKLSPITLPLSIVSKLHFDSQGQFLSYFSLVACRNMQNWRMPSSAYIKHIKHVSSIGWWKFLGSVPSSPASWPQNQLAAQSSVTETANMVNNNIVNHT